jgi:hypothetical protein
MNFVVSFRDISVTRPGLRRPNSANKPLLLSSRLRSPLRLLPLFLLCRQVFHRDYHTIPQHHLNASASTAISSSCTPSIPPLLLFSCVTFHCCSLTSCLTGLTSQHASSQAANTHCASASKVLNGHCTTSSSSGIPRVRAMYGILPLHPPSMSDMMRKEFPHAHHRI